jgi:hypothetical protein
MKIIRIIFSVALSLCLGAFICFALVASGVLKFQEKSEKSDVNSVTMKVIPPKSNKAHIHECALAFLATINDKGGIDIDIERLFENFLTRELKVKPQAAKQLVRMSFWKNFITLQQQWEKDDWKQLEAALLMEKELKIAGFKAMGLTLMDSALVEADAWLKEMRQMIGGASPTLHVKCANL